jgi:hypothetical protein
MFQFHTGSIKRIISRSPRMYQHRFQFHTGSIKSPTPPLAVGKVKLSFNSILVRLKVRTDISWWYKTTQFQFHTGSIKSIACYKTLFSLSVGFNSILVRLKGYWKRWSWTPYISFNSILVRLKVDLIKIHIGVGFMFQFHTGSIKSSCRA